MNLLHEDPVERLSEEESWAFLESQEFARLAFAIAGEPDIVPINIYARDRIVYFRTAEGSKLLAVSLGGRMAFQVDEWTHEGATSVLAHGTPHVLEGEEREAAAASLDLVPWVATHKEYWVRLDVDEIAGRSFAFGPEPDDYHPVG